MLNKKIKKISFDIDGVLNDYPKCWLEFIWREAECRFISTEEAKISLGLDRYHLLKRKYRLSGVKRNLDFDKWMVGLAKFLNDRGYEIVVITSRPLINEEYPNLVKDTDYWLKKIGMPHSALLQKDEFLMSGIAETSLCAHIEDELKYANAFCKNGVPVIYVTDGESEFESDMLYVLNKDSNIPTYDDLLNFIVDKNE